MPETIYSNAKLPAALTSYRSTGEPLLPCDITVANGLITSVQEAGKASLKEGSKRIDLSGRIVLPGFVDSHVHLDKAFTWDRAPNLRGEFWDAIELLGRDKDNWTEEDLYLRGSFALRCAEANGTVAMRTHVDTGLDWGDVSRATMQRLREEWAGRIEIQTVSLCGIEQYSEPGGRKIAEATMAYPGALLGGMPQMNPDLDKQLDYFFDLAAEMGAGVDLHVDENGNPEAECLRHVAETVLRKEFPYPVTCGHVCSLAVQDPARAASTIDLVKQSGIHIVSLPMCNLYLQGRPSESGVRGTPRWRGVTLLHEFLAAGVSTACASDNVRDAFYAWGDFDMFEVLIQSLRIAHLDTLPGNAFAMVSHNAATLMGLPQFGRIEPGKDGRLIAFEATSLNELFSRPKQKRELLGFATDISEPPPYHELGELKSL
ncbi:MAG: cytosine deaminase [Verrucomicrobiota bacterium]